MVGKESPAASFERQRLVFISTLVKIMIVLCSQYKKVFSARGQGAQGPEISFTVLAKIIIGPVGQAPICIGLVNYLVENIFGIIEAYSQDRPLVNRDVSFIGLSELRTK